MTTNTPVTTPERTMEPIKFPDAPRKGKRTRPIDISNIHRLCLFPQFEIARNPNICDAPRKPKRSLFTDTYTIGRSLFHEFEVARNPDICNAPRKKSNICEKENLTDVSSDLFNNDFTSNFSLLYNNEEYDIFLEEYCKTGNI